MQWSRYNLMFKSKNNGWLLYNSGSNSFVQMDEDAAEAVKQIKADPNMDYSNKPDLYFQLRLGGFLVENGKDDDLFRMLKMRRLISNYAEDKLLLTIALTKECNFACEYCYESNRVPSKITDETEDNLIDFIKRHKSANQVNITWYGGEPLLEIERMKSLYKKIEALGKKYSGSIITNGYCLTAEVIEALSDINISHVQITIDGSKETHDKRRVLIGGGPTYDRIIENIDSLMKSGWDGLLNVRVNVDNQNKNEFADVYRLFKYKYPGKFDGKITVYPGFVRDEYGQDSDDSFNTGQKGDFLSELAIKHGINALSIFPHKPAIGGCTMTKRNGYLVGPDGELYKCWVDLGRSEEVVGHITDSTGWNTSLIAECMVGASYLEDERCEKCLFFPICDGGCAKMRQQNNRDNKKRDTCSYFKVHAKELLEIHYEQKTGCHERTDY